MTRDYDIPDGLEDFRNFLWLTWDFLKLPDPTSIQYEVADWLQNGPERSITEGFRGMGKSWITSALVCHELLLRPHDNILVVSASGTRATEFSQFTLKLIHEMPILAPLIPRGDCRTSMVGFDVGPAGAAHAPSVKSIGITGQITGSRADRIIPDDIESSTNSLTVVMRDKLKHAVSEFESILKPGGRISYLGTPHLEETIYGWLEERGYKTRIWPARYPDKRLQEQYGERLSPAMRAQLEADPSIIGTPTEPARFAEEDLQKREASKGRSQFALQFMLDTALSDSERYPLKLHDLPCMDLNVETAPSSVTWGRDPKRVVQDVPTLGLKGDRWYEPMAVADDWHPYEGMVMAIDPSGSGSDECSYAVVGQLHGYLYLVDWGGFMSGYADATLQGLACKAKEWKANEIIIEANFGDGMFTKLLTPWLMKVYPCTTTEVKHSQQKEARMLDVLEPVVQQHRLVVNKRAVENDLSSVAEKVGSEARPQYTLARQMTHLSRQKGCLVHDDRVDVLSIAVQYWINHMGQDADEAEKEKHLQALQKEIEEFFSGPDLEESWIAPMRHMGTT